MSFFLQQLNGGIPSSASASSSTSLGPVVMLGSLSLLLLMSDVSVDDNDMVSPVGPFLFFFSSNALMTFEAFHFRVTTTFVECFEGPSDLCEAGMMVVLFFCFCHLLMMHETQFIKFMELVTVVIDTQVLISR